MKGSRCKMVSSSQVYQPLSRVDVLEAQPQEGDETSHRPPHRIHDRSVWFVWRVQGAVQQRHYVTIRLR